MFLLPRFDEQWEANALAAVKAAQDVRRRHAKKTTKGTRQRETDIRVAMDRLKRSMKPIRSEMGRAVHYPPTPSADANRARLSNLSTSIQTERRKLWKMRKKKMNGRVK